MKMIIKMIAAMLAVCALSACQNKAVKPPTHEQICQRIGSQLHLNQMHDGSHQPIQRAQLLNDYHQNNCSPAKKAS